MFKLLSRESNIFSIPVYMVFLLFIVVTFNGLNFNSVNIASTVITFAGTALGYFLFNKINLNYQTHTPLFLYTFMVFALYPGSLDIGIAVSLFTNSFILLLLTSTNDKLRKSSYILIGAILAVNFIFLPTTWPLGIFVLIHIIATSGRIGLNIFRLVFGMLLVFLSYFSMMFYLNYTSWDLSYFPFGKFSPEISFYPLYFLVPVALMMIYGVMEHFRHFNEKSPTSKFKYTFILVFSLAQLVTIILYMGTEYGYLLLLAFPASVILSRALAYMPKYWEREFFLWIIIISLLLFKTGNYIEFFN